MDKNYDHIKSEAQAQEFWHKNGIYKMSNNSGPIYSIDTPPPTVSGSLHIGHISSYTQADIIARYKRMSGFSVFYPLGFDDNGLPTERFVEKKNDLIAHNLSRSDFINLCLKETVEVEKKFEELWRKIGLSVDWQYTYSTIDNNSRKISQASFIDLYKKGYVYRYNEPALYCTTCRTAVSQAELDDIQKSTTFNDIIFKSESGQDLIISTTRPELLFSVNAIFFNPEDARYKHLANTKAIVPIYGHSVVILSDEKVQIDKGTGLVMCSTFGDKTDIEWFKKHKLQYRQSVGLDGKWVADTSNLAGLRVAAAREAIIKMLQEAELIINSKSIMHSVNVHERCKREIEYLVLPQWFMRILPYKQEFIDLADKISWSPAFMKARYKNWVENISWDWCISRQRFYGIPFPVWHCNACKAIILADINDLPIDPQEVKYNQACPHCGKFDVAPDTDVMDTWNTSSLTPYLCKMLYTNDFDKIFQKSEFMPMSMRPQAHDIIRTWAFDTIVKSWMHDNNIPWESIIISGHVLSTENQKISKSQGNAPLAPENLLTTYSADAIRYWTACGSLGYDLSFSASQISIGQRLLVKLWNAFRFIHTNASDYKFILQNKPDKLGTLNEWLLSEFSNTYKQYVKYFESNDFNLALDCLSKFFWTNFCDNYLELVKDQLLNKDKDIDATYYTLYYIGFELLQLYSPFIPHITETLYKLIYESSMNVDSIHRTRFKDTFVECNFIDSVASIEFVLEVIGQVRRLKTEKQLSLKTELKVLNIYSSNQTILDNLQLLGALINGVAKAQIINYTLRTQSVNITCEIEVI